MTEELILSMKDLGRMVRDIENNDRDLGSLGNILDWIVRYASTPEDARAAATEIIDGYMEIALEPH